MQGATLEALVAKHPSGRAAALLQQRALKVRGKEGMALRMRVTALEDIAAGTSTECLLITVIQSGACLQFHDCPSYQLSC